MHGGIDLPDGPSERFRKQAEDCLERAKEAVDPRHQRLWNTLALDCLRIAPNMGPGAERTDLGQA
jgi:hypothetical protein